ncbi:MAG: tetratricopeptide repeat protein [Halothiobacillaceae bacterium]|nr:tetratricopeptide repeat protein [Halothiobacillaceae bacterium]
MTSSGLTTKQISELDMLLKSGRYAEAESRARDLSRQYPQSGVVWKALGMSCAAQGKIEIEAWQTAARLLPGDVVALVNLADVQSRVGRMEDALLSYRAAIKLKPNLAQAHNDMATVLLGMGRLDEAIAGYRNALKIDPAFAAAHYNLGNALIQQDQPADANRSYAQALALKPDFFEAAMNLGLTQKELGQLDASLASFRRAVALRAHDAGAHNSLGIALQTKGELADAIASYRRALEIAPGYAEAKNNLGNALQRSGRYQEAVANFSEAIAIDPTYAMAHNNLGNAEKDLGKIVEAVDCYRRAVELMPDFMEAHSNLIITLNYHAAHAKDGLVDAARHFGALAGSRAKPYKSWRSGQPGGNLLHVGLVSGDLRAHPVGYFMENVLQAIAVNASRRIGITAYSTFETEDSTTERLKQHCQAWCRADRLSDEALARRIHDDGIDILIDLSGHTAHNRLPVFAWKPAPVQVSWLGYFATTGLTEMDYLLGDSHVTPPEEAHHFTETIWRMPETYLCFTEPDVGVAVEPLPALRRGFITFGCFNSLAKMNDGVVALWARVLKAVPQSCLYLKTKQLGDAEVRQTVLDRFARQGIDAGRLVLEGASPRAELLAAYNRVDIALDPFPYPGGTTSVEGLWMGVPVITRRGDRFLSHVGETIAHNAGLGDWVAQDEDDYVDKAVKYAADIRALAGLRAGLREQVTASPLFDAGRFARHFEEAMWDMWNRHLAQRPHSTIIPEA